MHLAAMDFICFVKLNFTEYFIEKKVLDVGSGDINGNNRNWFENCDYIGNDVCEGPNVTIVSRTKDLPFETNTFDTIVSTECFEHDPEYKESLIKIYDMLKPNGLFAFTCASTGRPEHGTRRTSPQDSLASNIEDMQDYYKNLTQEDINEVFKDYDIIYDTYYNRHTCDLFFVGIKTNKKENLLPKYINNVTSKTTITI